MYLSKSPIVVPMFSIRNIDSGRQINIYCEDEINFHSLNQMITFALLKIVFEKKKKNGLHIIKI